MALLIVCVSGAFSLALPPDPQTSPPSKRKKMFVYIGTYTGEKSKGIYVFQMDTATGALTPAELAAATSSPSFLAIHPNRRFLYAANEIGDFNGQPGGAVSAFAIDPKTGKLTFRNQQPSRGAYPCHLVVDRRGRNVLVANYGGGNVAVLPIQANGRLGAPTGFAQHSGSSVDKSRQEGPHAHSINLDRTNRFAATADLGLDKVLIYRFDARRGTLTPNDPPSVSVAPGGGPRHFAFHPNGRNAYANNELTSTVTAFRYDAEQGVLTELHTVSTLPEGFRGSNTTAEVQVHPSGKYLYCSNRGHDSIAVYAIDPATGRLRYLANQSTGGKTPRNFGIDPTGTFLLAANQATDTVVVFRIDPPSGLLKPTPHVAKVPTPVCVKFLPREE
jgi:6-phosphogluconolactonase